MLQQRKTHIWTHLYVESKNNDTNELIHTTETESQTSKTNLPLPEGDMLGGKDGLGI